MNAKSRLVCILICLILSLYGHSQVKRPLIIGRTSGDMILWDERSIRVFGFASRLSEKLNLPGTTIEAEVGDSLEIDFWNVSQGDPHDIKINGITLQKENERLAADADKNIRHMEHGYYSFVAKHPGTYIYYCPVNYPFNIQAGMFGILIIKPKKDNSNNTQIPKEQLWCSFEIDTNWHTDAVMDIERGEKSLLEETLTYQPQYFIVNSKITGGLPYTAMTLNTKQGETILIRLANTGLMQHLVAFPKELTVQVLTKNAAKPSTNKTSNIILLKPLETCELNIQCNTIYKGYISYTFQDEKNNIPVHVKKIPVSITKE